jgi:hypothetical protein
MAPSRTSTGWPARDSLRVRDPVFEEGQALTVPGGDGEAPLFLRVGGPAAHGAVENVDRVAGARIKIEKPRFIEGSEIRPVDGDINAELIGKRRGRADSRVPLPLWFGRRGEDRGVFPVHADPMPEDRPGVLPGDALVGGRAPVDWEGLTLGPLPGAPHQQNP